LPEIDPESADSGESEGKTSAGKTSVFQFPHLVLGVLCIFVYVGVEVIAIDALAWYGQFQGLDLNTSGKLGIYTLIALTIGSVTGAILIPQTISQTTALSISAMLSLIFATAALLTDASISIGFVIAKRFAPAFMLPAIGPLTLQGLGR